MAQTQNNPTPFFRKRIVVLAAGLVAMLLTAAGAWLAWRALPEVPVRELLFVNAQEGAFMHIRADDLARVARAVAATRVSVLRTDLAEVKAAVEQVAWVRRADVRRRLPDGIEVKIEEQIPYAVWRSANPPAASGNAADEETRTASNELINRYGEVFRGALASGQQAALPVLTGPPEAAVEVLTSFAQFSRQLAAIEIGRSDAALRLARFVSAYRQVAALQTPGAHLDLRYQSGLALRSAGLAVPAAKSAVPSNAKNRTKRI
jgi:cell division protein FtsQ